MIKMKIECSIRSKYAVHFHQTDAEPAQKRAHVIAIS